MHRQSIAIPPRLLAPLFATALFASGCGGGEKPASVSGHVTYHGKPVTSGVVVLLDDNGKASDSGAVQPDGTYHIAKSPAGKVKVAFDNPSPEVPANGAAKDPEAGDKAQAAALYVPTPNYTGADKTGVTLELKAGKNENCDIKLP